MADDDTTGTDEGLESRVGHLETTQAEQGTKLDAILDKLGHLVPGSHAEAEQRTETRLDRSSTVAEQVRAELARADAERKAAADADAEKSEREQMREQLAALREKPPVAPMPLRSRLLMKGWAD